MKVLLLRSPLYLRHLFKKAISLFNFSASIHLSSFGKAWDSTLWLVRRISTINSISSSRGRIGSPFLLWIREVHLLRRRILGMLTSSWIMLRCSIFVVDVFICYLQASKRFAAESQSESQNFLPVPQTSSIQEAIVSAEALSMRSQQEGTSST